jgi:hypothetical protein
MGLINGHAPDNVERSKPKHHSAEYFRLRREAQRKAKGEERKRYDWRADRSADHYPAEVFERGRVLALMESTPPCMWKPEWTAE